MLINIIKFIHLLCVMSLLSCTTYCLVLIGFKKRTFSQPPVLQLNKILLAACLLATFTGTLLVYPKHFTFHTPWIKAAYFLMIVFTAGISALILFKNNLRSSAWLVWLSYISLTLLLIVVVHDAVTKTTFLL